MKYKNGVVAPLLVAGLLIVGIFAGILVFGTNIGNGFGILSSRKNDQVSEAGLEETTPTVILESPAPEISTPSPAAPQSGNQSLQTNILQPTNSPLTQLEYTQPQGKYTILLPVGWIVESTIATTTYSTTKFSGKEGSISVTFGSGKDPIGGCSDTSVLYLADRTISGCLYLQKDGSQFLTRGYTEDVTGIPFTVEAYINVDSTVNRPIIFESIQTLDID